MLGYSEKSVNFLVETSVLSLPFLDSVQNQLADHLRRKSQQLAESFRFNVGHFSREVHFWDDQVSPCTGSRVGNAVSWIQSWNPTDYSKTPRGAAERSDLFNGGYGNGSHLLPALISGLSDPLVEAVALLAASPPHENTNDLLSHLRFASKGRPVHVTFLSQEQNVNHNAMELLHLLCKETGGHFRVAYFDSFGQLSSVRTSSGTIPTKENELGSVGSRKDELVELFSVYQARNQNPGWSVPRESQYENLKIRFPRSHSAHPSAGMGNYIQSSQNPNSISYRRQVEDPSIYDESPRFIRFRQKLGSEYGTEWGGGGKGEEMEEIKDMFRKLYAEKVKKRERRKKKKKYKTVPSKEFNFKHLSSHSKKSSSSSSSSSSSPDSSEAESEPELELKTTSRSRHSALSSSRREIPRSYSMGYSSRTPRTGRSSRPTEKPMWKPVSSTPRSFISSGLKTQTTDRSKMWMDPWWNSRYKNTEEKRVGERVEKVSGVMQRPKERGNKISLGTWTQTAESEPVKLQTEAIRDLVQQNSRLLNALERKEKTTKKESPVQSKPIENNATRNRVLNRIQEAKQKSQAQTDYAVRMARSNINNEIRDLLNGGAMAKVPNPAYRTDQFEGQRLDRQQQINNAITHRKNVQQDRQQQNYKAMYEKLVSDFHRTGPNNGQPSARTPTMIIPQGN